MDRIEALDWAIYSHFDFQIAKSPELAKFMEIAYYGSGYVGTAILLSAPVSVFLAQGKRRSALVCVLSFAVAVGLVHAMRWVVPRVRPENAAAWLGTSDMTSSYPAPGVFLFMLDAILIGFAIWDVTPRPWHRGLYVLTVIPLTVWVSMSQFVLPIHFFTDALGGMAGATLVGWAAYHNLEREPMQPAR